MGVQDSSIIVRNVGDVAAASVDWPRRETPRVSIREVGRTIARRGKLIVVVVVGLNLFALVMVSRLTPRFTAEADLMISPRQQEVVDLKAVLAGLSGDSDVIESEIQVLRSREIARSVVQQLNLDKLPEFNPVLAAPGLGAQVATELRSVFGELSETLREKYRDRLPHLPMALTKLASEIGGLFAHRDKSAQPAQNDNDRDALAAPVDAFLRHLGVAPRGRSRVIGVTFDSDNPALAAAAANAVVTGYIANQLKAKQDATSAAHDWLNERVTELREDMLNADQAVQSFRQRSGLTQGKSGALVAEQITETGEEIVKAKSFEADVDAKLKAAVAGRFRAQGLEQASEAAHDRVQSLETLFGQLRTEADAGNNSEVELRVLEHEADADRALYDRLLLRLKETKIEGGLQLPDAQIVSRAEAPADPTFPRIPIIMAVVFLASCLLAGLLAVLLERLATGYSSTEQLEDELGFPAIGVVPALKRRWRSNRVPETFVLEQPRSPFSETIRAAYTSLQLSRGSGSPKVILFTSALPGEGKSSTTLALGRMMASFGKRVVVVDCDMHRGRLRRACGLGFGPGLVDVLDGSAPVEAVVQKDSLSPAAIIPSGMARHASPDLIGSERMRAVLAQLATQFDLILLDSAPLLTVSDTRNLCRLADRTVLVVRWQETTQSAVSTALRQILEAGGQFAGCLLTNVDLRRYARYGERTFYQGHLGSYLLDQQ